MRRFFYSLAAVAGFVCGLAGCHHTAGVCDCDLEEDPCAARASWFRAPVNGVAPQPQAEQLKQAPNKL
ncbi:MAG: hypothetical protein L0Y71_08100 [Gemmataceae bacterium]|nr:hypothetical protein [Gemmataceae bacterium]